MIYAEKITARFWKKVNKTDSCWLWTGAKNSGGYGHFGITSKNIITAHKFSWQLHHGEIPFGSWRQYCVCHKCDVKLCINPSHLFLGSHQDNMKDRDRKGRYRIWPQVGERNGAAKLTLKQVEEIRRLYVPGKIKQAELAKKFGIAQAHVSSILRRKTWR